MTNNRDKKIYRKLQQHLDDFPIGFPATDSKVELDILQHLFSPMEATIACCLNLTAKTPLKVQARLRKRFSIKMKVEEVADHLRKMFMKGCIEKTFNNKNPRYTNAMLAIGMFEYQVDNLEPEFVKNMQKYFDEAFKDEFFKASIPQLRTSPHSKAILPEHKIALYDDIRSYVKSTQKKIQVANCVCKQGEALLGNPCQQTDDIEVCLIFDARSYVERGQTREISKKECLELLDRAEKEGLVLQPGNTREPFCICLCCGCCCGVLTTAKKFDKPAKLFASNYFADFNEEKCSSCGICVNRCQMQAITLEKKNITIDMDRCIGCGLCVTTCPEGAIELIKKKNEIVPPKSLASLYIKILKEKFGKKKMMLKMLKLLLGMI